MIIDTKLNTNQLSEYDKMDKYLYVNMQALFFYYYFPLLCCCSFYNQYSAGGRAKCCLLVLLLNKTWELAICFIYLFRSLSPFSFS